jgi:hypothetical protein
MRAFYVLLTVLLLGCESPIEELLPPPTLSLDPTPELATEVEVVPEVVEEVAVDATASVPASEAIPRLNNVVMTSSRFIGDRRATDVQRASTYHEHRFPRWMRESRIIQTDPSLDDPEALIDLTALVLARLGISEANWKAIPWDDGEHSDPIGELPRLYQVLRTQRRPGETLMNTMRNFSRIVSEMWEPSRARERWIAELTLECDFPSSFTEDERSWRQLYRERCEDVVQLARDLVRGRVNGRPCAGPLRAWGGRCDVAEGACDDPIARRRGLVPVETCGGENRYWAHPRRMTLAAVMAEIRWSREMGREPEPLLLAQLPGRALAMK